MEPVNSSGAVASTEKQDKEEDTMLYTGKDIEKIYSDFVAKYIASGARFDFSNKNYLSSEFDMHVDLIDKDNATKIIIYAVTCAATRKAFYAPSNGLFEIVVRKCNPVKYKNGIIGYPESNWENITLFQAFKYKNIYTNDEEEYRIMTAKNSERRAVDFDQITKMYEVKYDPSLILSIVRKRDGFKRSKLENILRVEKRNRKYEIYVNTRKNKIGNHYQEVITIG